MTYPLRTRSLLVSKKGRGHCESTLKTNKLQTMHGLIATWAYCGRTEILNFHLKYKIILWDLVWKVSIRKINVSLYVT